MDDIPRLVRGRLAARDPTAGAGLIAAAVTACSRRGANDDPRLLATMRKFLPRVTADAALLRREMTSDPAAPSQEENYGALVGELGTLAAVFVLHADSPDYRLICSELDGLDTAREFAAPVWESMRDSLLAHRSSRGRPPKIAKPKKPLADRTEYYAEARSP